MPHLPKCCHAITLAPKVLFTFFPNLIKVATYEHFIQGCVERVNDPAEAGPELRERAYLICMPHLYCLIKSYALALSRF